MPNDKPNLKIDARENVANVLTHGLRHGVQTVSGEKYNLVGDLDPSNKAISQIGGTFNIITGEVCDRLFKLQDGARSLQLTAREIFEGWKKYDVLAVRDVSDMARGELSVGLSTKSITPLVDVNAGFKLSSSTSKSRSLQSSTSSLVLKRVAEFIGEENNLPLCGDFKTAKQLYENHGTHVIFMVEYGGSLEVTGAKETLEEVTDDTMDFWLSLFGEELNTKLSKKRDYSSTLNINLIKSTGNVKYDKANYVFDLLAERELHPVAYHYMPICDLLTDDEWKTDWEKLLIAAAELQKNTVLPVKMMVKALTGGESGWEGKGLTLGKAHWGHKHFRTVDAKPTEWDMIRTSATEGASIVFSQKDDANETYYLVAKKKTLSSDITLQANNKRRKATEWAYSGDDMPKYFTGNKLHKRDFTFESKVEGKTVHLTLELSDADA